MKTENDEYAVKIVNSPRRPESDGEEIKQQKPKPPSPLIAEIKPTKPGEKVPPKPPSEQKPKPKQEP